MALQRYNFVYFPSDPEFAKRCVACAQEKFGVLSEGYLLDEKEALPHVSLCQFMAESDQVPDLWRELKKRVPAALDLKTTTAYSKPGGATNVGYTMVGLAIEPKAKLIESQAAVVAFLKSKGLETSTGVRQDYFPHLTLARLQKGISPDPSGAEQATGAYGLNGVALPFHVSLGDCGDTGVYIRHLYDTAENLVFPDGATRPAALPATRVSHPALTPDSTRRR